MKKSLLVIALFISIYANSQSNIDVLHYKFEINLNDKNDSINGVSVITFHANTYTLNITFDLTGINEKGRGMKINSVTFPSRNGLPPLTDHNNGKLVLTPMYGYNKGEKDSVIIKYSGIPSDGLIISKNKHGDRTFFADNWPDRAHHWLPCIDKPDDKASFEFIVTAPSYYKIISNGTEIEEKEIGNGKKLTHWKEDTPLPTKIMVIGAARFATKTFTDSPENIPVSAWSYPQDSFRVFKNFSLAPAIVKFLSSYIAPYPFEKLANVQSKTIFGGMENASAIFYDENLSASAEGVESLLSHEITHQWFGDMASEKSFPHLWLSEGFATYLTHIYIESKYGTDSLNKEMKDDRNVIIEFSKESNQPVVDFVSSYRRLLNPNSYQKGGWILHMLRRQVGDSVFHSIIKNYYAAYAGKNADTKDFQKICEDVTGKKLDFFFNQWLYTPGQPKLELRWKYDKKTKRVVVTVNQLQPTLFQFPLEIQLQSISGKRQQQTLSVTKKIQQFSFPVNEKILKLIADPRTSLLFEGSVLQSK